MANSLAHGPIQRLELASAHCPAGLFTPLVSARIWIGIQVSHSNRGYPLFTDSHSRAEGQFTGAWSHPATRTGLCALSCRSDERRGGDERRSRWSPYHLQ